MDSCLLSMPSLDVVTSRNLTRKRTHPIWDICRNLGMIKGRNTLIRKSLIALQMKGWATEQCYRNPVRAEVLQEPKSRMWLTQEGTTQTSPGPPSPPTFQAGRDYSGGRGGGQSRAGAGRVCKEGGQRRVSTCANRRDASSPPRPGQSTQHLTAPLPPPPWWSRSNWTSFLNPPRGERSEDNLREDLAVPQKLCLSHKEFKSPVYRNCGILFHHQQTISFWFSFPGRS